MLHESLPSEFQFHIIIIIITLSFPWPICPSLQAPSLWGGGMNGMMEIRASFECDGGVVMIITNRRSY